MAQGTPERGRTRPLPRAPRVMAGNPRSPLSPRGLPAVPQGSTTARPSLSSSTTRTRSTRVLADLLLDGLGREGLNALRGVTKSSSPRRHENSSSDRSPAGPRARPGGAPSGRADRRVAPMGSGLEEGLAVELADGRLRRPRTYWTPSRGVARPPRPGRPRRPDRAPDPRRLRVGALRELGDGPNVRRKDDDPHSSHHFDQY